MSHRILGAGLGAAAALALAAPAQAQDTDQYWFHCTGPSKVQNGATLAGAVPATGVTQALWNKTAPTASFQSGAGCGFADTPGPQRPSTTPENAYDAYYKGVHSKAIQSMKLELHNLLTSRARNGGPVKVLVRISEGTGTTATTLAEKELTATPTASSTGATEKVVVEMTGLAIKSGPVDRVLNITVHTADATPAAWVHDASEIPANVIFTSPPPATS